MDAPVVIGVVALAGVAVLGLLTHAMVSSNLDEIAAPWTQQRRRSA